MATQTTTTSNYGDRLQSSLRSIVMGIILFLAGTVLLFWNEGRTVRLAKDLSETEGLTVQVDDVSTIKPDLEGKIIHASGNATTEDVISDEVFGVKEVAIRMTRTVQYYQLVQKESSKTKDKIGGGKETVTTYTYSPAWVSKPLDSSEYVEAEQRSKNFTLATLEDTNIIAPTVRFEAYTLPEMFKGHIGIENPVNISLTKDELTAVAKQFKLIYETAVAPANTETNAATPAVVEAPANTEANVATPAVVEAPANTEANVAAPAVGTFHVNGNTIYMGKNPQVPTVGDVRITFVKYLPCTASLIAKVVGNTFGSHKGKSGNTVSMIRNGEVSAEAMFEGAHSGNMTIAWLLRLLSVFLIIFGLKSMVSILQSLAMVLPFLGNFVGMVTGVVCTILGLAWSLVIFAIAWVTYRPVLGISLLVAAGVLLVYLIKRGKTKTPPTTDPISNKL